MGSVRLTSPKRNEGGCNAEIWAPEACVVTSCNDKKEKKNTVVIDSGALPLVIGFAYHGLTARK